MLTTICNQLGACAYKRTSGHMQLLFLFPPGPDWGVTMPHDSLRQETLPCFQARWTSCLLAVPCRVPSC